MTIPVPRIAKRIARNIYNRALPGTLILAYHRVASLTSDPQLLCVSPENFAGQLEALRNHYTVLGLDEFVALRGAQAVPPRCIVITFDDGYIDNLLEAAPALAAARLPATFFVTSRVIEDRTEFYWDALERILLYPNPLPERLEMSIDGKGYAFDLGKTAWREENYTANSAWSVVENTDPSRRHTLYRELHRLLRPVMWQEQNRVISALHEWSGVSTEPRPSHSTMGNQQLLALANYPQLRIGAHSVKHSMFSKLPDAEIRTELRDSKRSLEELIGRPVDAFAYPYGGPRDFDVRAKRAAREMGFTCACANFFGTAHRWTNGYQLPRLIVRDWDKNQFAKHLAACF